MPNGNIGVSAMDALQPGGGGTSGAPSGVRGASPQQAVKIYSLRVPERVSQGAIAPVPLLTSKGSAAPGAQGLDSMVAALMQAFKSQGSLAGPSPATATIAPSGYDADGSGSGPGDVWSVPRDPGSPRRPVQPIDDAPPAPRVVSPEPAPAPSPNNPPPPSFKFPYDPSPAPLPTWGANPIPEPGQPDAPQSPLPTFGAMPVPSDDGPAAPSPIFDNGPIDFPADEPAPAPSLFDGDAPEQPWWMQKNDQSLFSDF